MASLFEYEKEAIRIKVSIIKYYYSKPLNGQYVIAGQES